MEILVGLAALFGFQLFSTDVTQAYLQGAEKLKRDVYIKPSAEFGLCPNRILKLLIPLYGLADSGDHWGRSLRDHLLKDIGMSAGTTDGALFFRKGANQLTGVCATHVDDCLHAANAMYLKISQSIEKRFQCRDREFDRIQFSSVHIATSSNGFCINQDHYIKTIDPLPKDVTFAQYSSLRAKLMWLLQIRPDISCAVAQSTQVPRVDSAIIGTNCGPQYGSSYRKTPVFHYRLPPPYPSRPRIYDTSLAPRQIVLACRGGVP